MLRRLAARYAELLQASLRDRLVAVVLFGSVARGEASPGSDVDLLIVARDLPRGVFARKRLLEEADDALASEIAALRAAGIDTRLSRIVRTPEEASRIVPLYLDMTQDAILLHDAGGFFAGVLQRLTEALTRLGSKRMH